MENRLALIYDEFYISWFALFVAAGCLLGMLVAALLRGVQKKYVSDVFLCTALGVPLGLAFARWFYCLFSLSEFNDIDQMLDLTNGGYGLYGAIFGVFFAGIIVNGLFNTDGFGELLDCMVIGGALAITIGRFATYFTGSELGYEVNFSVMTVYDEAQDLHTFAVYMLDGIIEAVIFLTCLCFFIFCRAKGSRERIGGKTALVMLALHGANQVLIDSMRADALKLGANNFIKMSQIIGIVSCIAVLIYFIVLSAKARQKFGVGHIMSLIIMLECIGFGVLAEYRVGNGNYISKHIMMLAAMFILGVMVVHYGGSIVVNKPPKAKPDAKPNVNYQPASRAAYGAR